MRLWKDTSLSNATYYTEDQLRHELFKVMSNDLYGNEDVNDYDFSEIIYDVVIPKLLYFGCVLENEELNNNTSYDNVMLENY